MYPPLHGRVADLRSLCESQGVGLHATDNGTFYACLNLNGDSDQQLALARCRDYCPFLRTGRLHTCAMSAMVGYFNGSFEQRIPVDGGIDIHAPGASGRAILRQLNRPIETCKWCSPDVVRFPWSPSRRRLSEWDAGSEKAVAGRQDAVCPSPPIHSA